MRQTTTITRLLSAALIATAASASYAADTAPAQPAPAAQQAPQAQTAGDASVAAQAAAALQQDKDLQTLPLTVSSTAEGVIVIRGSAPSAAMAEKAVKLVAAVPGVKEVRNEIKVG